MSVVSTEMLGNIAVITVDNPPVNALSQAVRAGIMEAIDAVNGDDNISVAILTCSGRTFIAGADITEFGKPPQAPGLGDVVAHIEASEKPVIAAIHGTALGGGLEVALGCHYRVGQTKSKAGLPEVALGLLPGAGGTQRLPRLVGANAALDMITTGRHVGAAAAQELGLYDIIADDHMGAAMTLAGEVTSDDLAGRRLSTQAAAAFDQDIFDSYRSTLAKRRRGFMAPQHCITAVETGCTMEFGAGMERERELFMELMTSDQSKAQRHLFFAERTCGKIPGLDRSTEKRNIKNVGIIGGGTMGGGIAMSFAAAGFKVTLLEINEAALAKGIERIRSNYAVSVKRGKLTDDQVIGIMANITGTTDYEDFGDADMVIEAVFEKMEVKKPVFEALDRVCKPGAILASNTSYLDIDQIASFTKRPSDVLGMHFFSPANIMRLLEIVRGAETAPDVLATAVAIAKKIGKVGVVSGVCPGFIGNRMFSAYQFQVGTLMLEGASPSQIDRALYGFGMAMGPCAVSDLAGLDIGYFNRNSGNLDAEARRPFLVHDRLVEMDRLGQKSGAGIYDYPDGARIGVENPMVLKLIKTVAAEQDITQKDISDEEIINRCMLAMFNTGSHIMDENIAYRSSDIDVVYVNGYGFPRFVGGPMCWANMRGLDRTLNDIEAMASAQGERWWKVAPLLREAVEKSTSL